MADKAIEPGKKSTERYLPKAAWAAMSNAERKKSDDKKKRESRKGKQFVKNTDKAKKARKAVSMSEKRITPSGLKALNGCIEISYERSGFSERSLKLGCLSLRAL